MNNLLKISLLAIVLSSCSSEDTPTPQKLSHDIQTLPPYTGIAVLPQERLPVPTKNAQLIERRTTFKVLDNVYSEYGNKIIVPRGAIITGIYDNDGTECKIIWKSIYANKTEYKAKRGTFSLNSLAQPSVCDPLKGIKTNQRIMIRVNSEFLD